MSYNMSLMMDCYISLSYIINIVICHIIIITEKNPQCPIFKNVSYVIMYDCTSHLLMRVVAYEMKETTFWVNLFVKVNKRSNYFYEDDDM